MEDVKGPVLSDREFFEKLNYSEFPELSKVKQAVDIEDYTKAKEYFKSFIQGFLTPEKYFSAIGEEVAHPELTASLKEKAEKALAHEMCSCGTPFKFEGTVDWYSNPTYNNYSEWTWQLSRHAELVTLSKAYRASGDERYAEGCAELWDSWLKQAVRPEEGVPCGATLAWRTLEAGIRMDMSWPEMVHSFFRSPLFSATLITDIFKSIYEHSMRLRATTTGGNWLIHEVGGLFQTSIFYPFFTEAAEWRNFSLSSLERELTDQVYPDGFQCELTTGYHNVVIHHYMLAISIALAYDIEIPHSFLDTIQSMLHIFIKVRQADGNLPNVNDGSHAPVKGLIAQFASHFPNDQTFKWILSDASAGEKPNYDSILLPYSGYVTFRSGWGKDDVSAFFDGGPFGRAHQHEDKLNFLLYANGKQLLCEANSYAYDTSDMRRYVLSTRAHNTVRVNGMDQNRRKGYRWKPEFLDEKADVSFIQNGDVELASAVYDEGYGNDQIKPAVHKRTVAFLKAPKQGMPLFIVLDELTSNDENENEYEIIWHYLTEKAELGENKLYADELTTFLCGDVGKSEVVSGVTEPELQGWYCHSALQGSARPTPTLLHKIKAVNASIIAVHSIHKPNEASPILSVSYDKSKRVVIVTYSNGESDTIEF